MVNVVKVHMQIKSEKYSQFLQKKMQAFNSCLEGCERQRGKKNVQAKEANVSAE